MLSAILGIFTSGGFGAVTGLVGAFMSKREERKVLELNCKTEVALARIDADRETADHAHSLKMFDMKLDETELEGNIATDVAEMGNVKASIIAQSQPSGVPWIDGVLRFVRPAITGYLLIMCTIIAVKMDTIVGGLESLSTTEVFSLYVYIIESLVFLTTTAVAWWFGSRGMKRERT